MEENGVPITSQCTGCVQLFNPDNGFVFGSVGIGSVGLGNYSALMTIPQQNAQTVFRMVAKYLPTGTLSTIITITVISPPPNAQYAVSIGANKTTINVGETLVISGTVTSNGSPIISQCTGCVRIINIDDPSVYMDVGIGSMGAGKYLANIPVTSNPYGTFHVQAKYLPTGTVSPTLTITIVSSQLTMIPVANGQHFTAYVQSQAYYNANVQLFTDSLSALDACYDKLAEHFGFTLPSGFRFEVKDQLPGGIAYASYLTIGYNGPIPSLADVRYTLFHEVVNAFTGQVSAGWPWADGSYIWRAVNPSHSPYTSPFPYAASTVILEELGYTAQAQAKLARGNSDTGMLLFYNILKSRGWDPFKELFQAVKQFGIDLSKLPEPLATGAVVTLMSWKTGTDYIALFNNLFANFNISISVPTVEQILSSYGITLPTLNYPTDVPVPNVTNPIVLIVASALVGGVVVYFLSRRRDG